MNKKLLPTAIVATLILVIVFSYFQKNNKDSMLGETPNSKINIDDNETSLSRNQASIEILENAKISMDPNMCYNIPETDSLRVNCFDEVYFMLGTSQNNKNECSKINEVLLQGKCKDAIIYSESLSSLNPKTCKDIKEEVLKANCLSEITMKYIESDKFKNDSNSVLLCADLHKQDKDYCTWRIDNHEDIILMREAFKNEKFEDCTSINDLKIKESCEIITKSIKSSDLKACEKSLDANIKLQCQIIISIKEIKEAPMPDIEIPKIKPVEFKQK